MLTKAFSPLGTNIAPLRYSPLTTAMLKQLTYKQKTKALFFGSVLLLALIYTVSIKRTLNLHRDIRILTSKSAQAVEAPVQIKKIRRELDQLQGNTFNLNNKEALLGEITRFCEKNNLLIVNLPVASTYEEGNYEVESRALDVQGGFKDILELVYLIEYQKSLGVVSSLRFVTKKDPRTKKKRLTGHLVLRSINQ